ncbi:hypothetical protein NBRC116588_31650 [Pyruvatibacter sp. HU-CL02332]
MPEANALQPDKSKINAENVSRQIMCTTKPAEAALCQTTRRCNLEKRQLLGPCIGGLKQIRAQRQTLP